MDSSSLEKTSLTRSDESTSLGGSEPRQIESNANINDQTYPPFNIANHSMCLSQRNARTDDRWKVMSDRLLLVMIVAIVCAVSLRTVYISSCASGDSLASSIPKD